MAKIPNLHKDMADSQLHVPKSFEGALADTHMEKSLVGTSELRDVRWYENFYSRPVLKFVDGALAPPTEVDLDRYVLLQLSGTATSVDAGWDGAAFNDIVQLDATASGGSGNWETSTPLKGFNTFTCETNTQRYFNGTDWFDLTGATFEGIRNGDDTFNTIDEAVTAVGSGETITVVSGLFSEGDLFANATVSDFNMDFEVGAIVSAPTGLEAIFDTSSLPGAADINIIGYGEFIKATDAGLRGIVYSNNNSDVLSVQAMDMDSKGNTTVWVEDAAGTAEVMVKVSNRANSDGGGVLYSASGIINADIYEAVESTGGDVVLTDNAQSQVYATFDSVDGGYTGDGGIMFVTAQRAINNFVAASAGVVSINGVEAELKTGTAVEMIANTGANLKYQVAFTDMDIATGVAVLHHTSGTTEVTTILKNERDLATANGVKISGGGLILKHSRVEVTHVDAVAVSAAAPQTMTSRLTSFDAPIESNVTFLEAIMVGDSGFTDYNDAKEAAREGDTIMVPSFVTLPSTLNDMLKDGVRLHIEANHTYSGGGTASMAMFDSTGFTKQVVITGKGVFTNNAAGAIEGRVFQMLGGLAGIANILEFDRALATTTDGYFGTTLTKINGDIKSTAGAGITGTSVNRIILKGGVIESTAGVAVNIFGSGSRIRGHGEIISTVSVGLLEGGTDDNSVFTGLIQGITSSVTRSARNRVSVTGTFIGKAIDSGTNISASGDRQLVVTGFLSTGASVTTVGANMVVNGEIGQGSIEASLGNMTLNAHFQTRASSNKIFNITGGKVVWRGDLIERISANVDTSIISSGSLEIIGGTFEGTSNTTAGSRVVIRVSGTGKLTCNGNRIVANANSTTGHVIDVVGAAAKIVLKAGAELITSNVSAKDIKLSEAADVHVYGTNAAVTNNTTVDPFITIKGGGSIFRNSTEIV